MQAAHTSTARALIAGLRLGWLAAEFGGSPGEHDREAGHGEVGVAVRASLCADLYESDDGQQRDEVPCPADGQVRMISGSAPDAQGDRQNRGCRQDGLPRRGVRRVGIKDGEARRPEHLAMHRLCRSRGRSARAVPGGRPPTGRPRLRFAARRKWRWRWRPRGEEGIFSDRRGGRAARRRGRQQHQGKSDHHRLGHQAHGEGRQGERVPDRGRDAARTGHTPTESGTGAGAEHVLAFRRPRHRFHM